MFLHTWSPSPIAFSLGNLQIHWYGILLAVGALVGYTLSLNLAKRRGLSPDHITNLALWLIPAGLIGARLYHVTNEWGYYRLHANEIFSIWNGGLAIHGALLSGLIALGVYVRKYKLNTWQILDVLMPGVVLGQIIGRWGNYFNQELFGKPTTLPWGIPIDSANRPGQFALNQFFHPTFLYESLGNVVILGILLWLFRKSKRPGTVALAYFLLYAILRIMSESLRIDRTPLVGSVRLPIIISSLIIIAAVTTFFMYRPKSQP